MSIEIREIQFRSPEYEQEVFLRNKILREPLGMRLLEEDLAGEGADIHLGAFQGATLVACLILSPLDGLKMKMRQVAVDRTFQGGGLGRKLVFASEDKARSLGANEIILNARLTAVPFYLKLGYQVVGEPLVEVKTPHRQMRKIVYSS